MSKSKLSLRDLESRLKMIDLKVGGFDQLAREFNLVLEPLPPPKPATPIMEEAAIEEAVSVALAQPQAVVVAPPPPPPPAPAPVSVAPPEPATISPSPNAAPASQAHVRTPSKTADESPLPQPGEGTPVPVVEEKLPQPGVGQAPLPKAPVKPPPPPPPKEAWPTVLLSLGVLLLTGGSWYAVEAWQRWQAGLAHRVYTLDFGNAAVLAVKDGRIDTVDPQRGLLFTLEPGSLATKSIQKFSDHAIGGLAWGKDCLWTTAPDESWVLQREDGPGAKVRRVFEVPDTRPTALAWDGRELWVYDSGAGMLRRYGVGERLALIREWPLETSPAGLHVADELVWVVEKATRKIVRYRVGPFLEPFDTIDLGRWLPADRKVAGFAVHGGAIWILTNAPSAVHRLQLSAVRSQLPGGRKQ